MEKYKDHHWKCINDNEFERLRNKYRPKIIKVLIIGESPPNKVDHFFYNPNNKRQNLGFWTAVAFDIAFSILPKLVKIDRTYIQSYLRVRIERRYRRKWLLGVYHGYINCDIFKWNIVINSVQ